MEYRYITYFDASAAVKLALNEPGSGNVRNLFSRHHRHYMTNLCFAEALGVLKRKFNREELSRDAYFDACYLLTAYLKYGRLHLDDTLKIDLEVVIEAENLAKKYEGLDLSDALQIITVKGAFKHMAGESKTVLATADSPLEEAAKHERLARMACGQGSGAILQPRALRSPCHYSAPL
jgi:predicted nucleic acid-binding protein